ncbi:MAG: ABC transporter substrate-binding protein [Campylobacterales bacterium]|nr:ABC transporter substrate-binding protein [Campylobacterales bacterium]
MRLQLAIEWFLNPDHLPFIVAQKRGIFKKYDISFDLIEPDAHYDGLGELLCGNIALATNEPLHLIEQFDEKLLSLGTFFETKGGVLLKRSSYEKLVNGQSITVTTPVCNDKTNAIGFEIIRRYYAKQGFEVLREQVRFEANGFEHLRHMREGADAGWLYFYNFEGIEAQHLGMDVLYLDAENAGFANFSALDIFVNKPFYHANTQACENFLSAVREAIVCIREEPQAAMDDYYAHTKSEPSALMDEVLHATMGCFDADFASSYARELPILEFFTQIGITDLEPERFKTAFLN